MGVVDSYLSGSDEIGGVVGYSADYAAVTNCYNTGNVTGKYVVGVVGFIYYKGSVTNCYNIGSVSGKYIGGVLGNNNNGDVTNCYYLDTAATKGIGLGSGTATAKTVGEFQMGSVAYLLGAPFGQTLDGEGEKDTYPLLGAPQFYYGYLTCAVGAQKVYTNDSTAVPEKPAHVDTGNDSDHECDVCDATENVCYDADHDGDHDCDECDAENVTACVEESDDGDCTTPVKCTECDETLIEGNPSHTYTAQGSGICINGCYEPAILNGEYYEISNAGQLFWFAQLVNGGSKTANARLMADIDLENADWTIICETGLYYNSYGEDLGYAGTFDGNGHVIKNFKGTSSSTIDASAGLFGTVSGTVKNLGVEGFTFVDGGMDIRAGAIVGQLITANGLVQNCYVSGATITPGEHVTGGIAGCVYDGTIESCYVVNSNINGTSNRYGYIVGDSRGDDGDNDRKGTVTSCYTDKSPVYSSRTGNVTRCETRSAEQFASGEVAYLLGTAFGQDLKVGEGDDHKDSLPVFATEGNTVYYGYLTCANDAQKVYTNDRTAAETKPEHTDVDPKDHICDECEAEEIGAHEEGTTVDHKCDYCGVLDEAFGIHADGEDNDHLCDYCNGSVGEECYDENPKDHRCDECNADNVTEHIDGNDADHLCDNGCGKIADDGCHDVNTDTDHKCDECNADNVTEHTPVADDGDCTTDITCSVCGTVTTEGADSHTGGAATCTEKAKCTVCGKEYGEILTHSYGTVYKNDANEHWNECACGDKANKATHVDADGNERCDACEYAMPKASADPGEGNADKGNTNNGNTGENDGFGAGATVAIVIGSVVVLGGGGFAIFWFVIKKKSWADLIKVFKK